MEYKTNIKTVGELCAALKDFPSDMPLTFGAFGYDGDTPVSIRPKTFDTHDGSAGIELEPFMHNGVEMCQIKNASSKDIEIDVNL